jgi:Recombination endonuclease VII
MPVTAEDRARYNRAWKEKNPEKAKESHRLAQLKWRAKNREKVRQNIDAWRRANMAKSNAYRMKEYYKRKYGLTREGKQELLESQGNCCAACGSNSPNHKQGWVVDHCHKSNRVRGILCQPCNLTLGKVKDSPDHLRKLADYLEKHSAND